MVSPVLQTPTENRSLLPNVNVTVEPKWAVSPWEIAPHNAIKQKTSNRGRKHTVSTIITGTPHRNSLIFKPVKNADVAKVKRNLS